MKMGEQADSKLQHKTAIKSDRTMADRHHCFKSGNIPITDGGQNAPPHCSSHMISVKF